jgi:hypothetical protein
MPRKTRTTIDDRDFQTPLPLARVMGQARLFAQNIMQAQTGPNPLLHP